MTSPDHCRLAQEQVPVVLDERGAIIGGDRYKREAGEFGLLGLLKVSTIEKPAMKARKGTPAPSRTYLQCEDWHHGCESSPVESAHPRARASHPCWSTYTLHYTVRRDVRGRRDNPSPYRDR
jgi:hypothetical protein